jgi:hypothetical protein
MDLHLNCDAASGLPIGDPPAVAPTVLTSFPAGGTVCSVAGVQKKSHKRARLVAAVKAAQREVDALPVGRPFSPEHSKLRDADRRLRQAREKLKAFDRTHRRKARPTKKPQKNAPEVGVPGAPSGLVTSGLGLIKVVKERRVGDSQSSHRKHNLFRKK